MPISSSPSIATITTFTQAVGSNHSLVHDGVIKVAMKDDNPRTIPGQIKQTLAELLRSPEDVSLLQRHIRMLRRLADWVRELHKNNAARFGIEKLKIPTQDDFAALAEAA